MSDFYLFIRKELYYPGLLSLGAVPGAFIRWQLDNDLLVNLLGSGLLGFLISLQLKNKYNLILAIGFCGALTTFSGWIVDCAHLLLSGAVFKTLVFMFAAVFLGLATAAIGFVIGKLVKPSRPFLLRFLFRRH